MRRHHPDTDATLTESVDRAAPATLLGGGKWGCLGCYSVELTEATCVLIISRLWMIGQGPSARDLALTGIAVDG